MAVLRSALMASGRRTGMAARAVLRSALMASGRRIRGEPAAWPRASVNDHLWLWEEGRGPFSTHFHTLSTHFRHTSTLHKYCDLRIWINARLPPLQ